MQTDIPKRGIVTTDRRTAAAAERWALAHRDELVRDLCRLISIPSIAHYGENGLPMGTACKEALDCFHLLARQYGLEAQNVGDHCVRIRLPGKTGAQELGILGHLDVVPPGGGWKYDPFCATEKNGFVIGRGACDNKGPLVMALYTLRCMRELGIVPDSDICLIAGCDEEQEMRDVRYYLTKHQPPAFTLNCDGNWGVCIGEKGILTADLTLALAQSNLISLHGGEASNMVPASACAVFRPIARETPTVLPYGCSMHEEDGLIRLCASGKAAHCAVPTTGDNAIRRLLQALCRFTAPAVQQKLNCLLKAVADDDGTGLGIRYADVLSGSTTCAASLLSMQDDVLRLHIDVRFAVTQDAGLLVRQLQSRCEKLGLGVENLVCSPPRYDDPSSPEIRLLLDTCREFLGRRHQAYVTGGGTHSRLFPRSVPFGPLDTSLPRGNALGGPHAADEAVSISDLIQGLKVYTAALLRLDRRLKQS